MPQDPVPSSEFGPSQKVAFALAGAVALPSPFPASGKVFIGVFPKPANGNAAPRFYLKSVQSVSERHVVTRLIDLKDLRAVRVWPDPGAQGQGQAGGPMIVPAEDLGDLIAQKTKALLAIQTAPVSYETELFAQEAILYVPEAAPVLLRMEYAVTAAVCAEGPLFAAPPKPCPDGMPPFGCDGDSGDGGGVEIEGIVWEGHRHPLFCRN